ncbi:hypothetical protein SAMD00019534_037560 [Acytostelium subglobosum LB1]|uniref:hypothetical protein n=1 Tax=Acytostelium subglobosum LB1 TaxID=1410327 RepID=UPI000644E884|nr:hypothetical protein SAMD00019534_037560 [Acytostelium subglobosum LB1]GAM20581.1 hypothetical protein SAMD00019534_037560 [Acytostelium subglobosum LB1]|eukprot:XP_012760102.1 hypothetical protein SAMD00019534_037560 [Acytostelium subglobosum LB1]
MPPKPATGKKGLEKEKKQKIEDKTFGLKNKNKSKKVAQFVKNVEQQVSNNVNLKKVNHKAELAKKDKELAEKAKKELADILRPSIVQPKVPLGVDPKSIVCEFFKQGAQCAKGSKCKFAHDLAVARRDTKLDIYTDRRGDEKVEKKADNMETWDDDKLKKVIDNKRTTENKNLKTAIVCKFFLEAIEDRKYGWFWECPNGGDKCMYQHCLPPGYVLQKKKTKKEEEEEEEEIPLEEIIEMERAKLTNTTPVTLETFTKWKKDKLEQKAKMAREAEEKRTADIKAGKTSMSGREMFVYNPDLFIDDDLAIDVQSSEFAVDDSEPLANNIDKSLFIGGDEDLPDISDDDEDDEDDDDEDDDEEDDEEEEEDDE